ncbi:MAG: trypsin-like peptidase domain-containing protein [Bacteriovoracaceae bacterium]|nr:trypsin-like peptidase domain-containing protein [Bacteriovoracaceae bacterium]
MSQKALILYLILFVSACGKPSQGPNSEIGSSPVIIGELNWDEIPDLKDSDPRKARASAVADLDLPRMQARCTGFLISEDLIMTNQHCVPSRSLAPGTSAIFNRQKGISSSRYERYDCSEFVASDYYLDFTILRCKNSPGKKYGYFTLKDVNVSRGEKVHVIQQNCNYLVNENCVWNKKVASGKVTDLSNEVSYDADTLGGSSGSPVINDKLEVIALHHQGISDPATGLGLENQGVYVNDIIDYLELNHPWILDANSTVVLDKESNNRFKDANKISYTTKTEFQGSIGQAGDEDYFEFTLSRQQSLKFHLKFINARSDLDLALYDANHKLIQKSSSSKTDFEYIQTTLRPGKYYFRICGWKKAFGPYEMLVEGMYFF